MLLDRWYRLPDGPQVRLRLARSSDARPIRELAAHRGLDADPLEVALLTRFDPRRRLVICATGLIDGRETLVGVGAIELAPDGRDESPAESNEPETLIYDRRFQGLGELLVSVLVARAEAIARARARARAA